MHAVVGESRNAIELTEVLGYATTPREVCLRARDRAANRLSFLAAMRCVMMVKSAEVFPDPSEPMAITLFDGPDHMPVVSIGHGILEVMALCGARVFPTG